MLREGKVDKVGVEFFDSAVAAQALYKLNRADWRKWLDNIVAFCEAGKTNIYAENALNELEGAANIYPVDMENLLCAEIDDAEDLMERAGFAFSRSSKAASSGVRSWGAS